jgi:hypothetical protein
MSATPSGPNPRGPPPPPPPPLNASKIREDETLDAKLAGLFAKPLRQRRSLHALRPGRQAKGRTPGLVLTQRAPCLQVRTLEVGTCLCAS